MSEPLTFKNDQWVVYQGREGRVIRTPNLHEVQLRDRNGDVFTAPIHTLVPLADLQAPESASPRRVVDAERTLTAQREAVFRLQAVSPLLHLGPGRSEAAVQARAAEVGCHAATLYRWIRQFERAGDLSGLIRKPRHDQGRGRLAPEVERLMESVIERVYLQDDRPLMTAAYTAFLVELDAANRSRATGERELGTPDFQSFRRRIYRVEERHRVGRRYGRRGSDPLSPVLGHYPGATYPLAVVQVDHTPMDVMVVDAVHRTAIGRPTLTLVMDVFSRVVLGFYISLDAPSAFAVGMAVTHAILPKTLWLARHRDTVQQILEGSGDVSAPGESHPPLSWPCWGKPVMLKTDNGKEFWGKMLELACTQYHISKEFRPVHNPKFGGHIERIIGTVHKQELSLPGKTFSNSMLRGDYDAEGKATMTLEGLEVWVAAYLLGVYHNRVHRGLGVTPLQRWEEGLLTGTDEHPPTGLPEQLMGDRAERLKMDFLPFFEATVQRAGVRHDNLTYMSEVLHRYVLAKHPERPGTSRTFIFRYDPRDVSVVYFLDPDLDRYFAVRCRQPNFPSISVWELRATMRFARARHLKASDDRTILAAHRMMNAVVQAEGRTTKQVRLAEDKRRRNEQGQQQAKRPVPEKRPTSLGSPPVRGNIKPFDDIDF
ncbi:Mu transposase C-terminal domain-containing protein [Deinococcus sp.]|uniref:Mu transposase C-terminal domain-containing protein n=1 Tax=Deinococcus sp. TaxID=47478 RepID=UPI0025D1CE2C|nr:Mu transposase C-terminal domain-containing protein [Deinococcus sp.]